MRGDLQEGHVYDKRLCGYASRCQSPSSRAQKLHFFAFLASRTPIFRPFKHKIGVFVLFWPLEPLFSGDSSTKSRFLCAFDLRNPHFRAFRAQNWGFCALLPEGGRPLAGDAYGKKVYIQGTMPELKARCQNCGHDAKDAAGWGEIRRLRQCRSLACTCVVLE